MPPGGDSREEVPERQKAEALFLANLEWIERSAASLCRRYGMGGDEAKDVGSWVKLKIIEDDYAPIRKFRGDSSIRTYLVVVVASLFRDYRAGHWGRWRPSAAALRAGPLAVRLETLVHRDGCTLDQAARTLRESPQPELQRAKEMTDGELARMLAELPVRGPLRPFEAGEAPLDAIPAVSSAEERVAEQESDQTRRTVFGALERVMGRLQEEDRVILQLVYWQGLTIAQVARVRSLPQKPLYRRIERILGQLRRELPTEGVQPEQLRDFLGELTP